MRRIHRAADAKALPPASLRCLSWRSGGPSMLVQICTRCSRSHASFSSSIAARLVTSVKSIDLPSARLRSSAYSTACFSTGKLSSGSPPCSSIVTAGEVVASARSIERAATSRVMSVDSAFIGAREAWQ